MTAVPVVRLRGALVAAMQEDIDDARGLGLGLGGTRRLVDEFSVESEPGHGTRVEIVQWLKRP